MEWDTFAQLWGPAVPMFGIFVWYLHRLIFRTVPRGFRTLRAAIVDADEKAAARHDEAMASLGRVEEAMVHYFADHPRKRTRPRPRARK